MKVQMSSQQTQMERFVLVESCIMLCFSAMQYMFGSTFVCKSIEAARELWHTGCFQSNG
ncbi:hypothetical protein HanPSC8_Chr13g0586911 [Helianthus annuus]|nr:hypothetical protein HanPSC8_Chr13g0586911 [Helianthus annuus]